MNGQINPSPSDLKWNQPPVTVLLTNVYYGWNEPSALNYSPLAADDWVCTTVNPVTAIRWWGSYEHWVSSASPPQVPFGFQISFWSDVPAGVDAVFSHPGVVLHQVFCYNVTNQFFGWDYDPRMNMYEACFQFDAVLDQSQWFRQGQFGTGPTNIYWISIAAMYSNAPVLPQYLWGWKTRARDPLSTAPDSAVMITDPSNPGTGQPYMNGYPLHLPDSTNAWDFAFELRSSYTSSVSKVYEQPPDLSTTGMDVNDSIFVRPSLPPNTNGFLLADDFLCTNTCPITHITIWGSWRDDYYPQDPGNLSFTLSLHDNFLGFPPNIPSMPTNVLWTKTYLPGEFGFFPLPDINLVEGWMNPPNGYVFPGDHTCFQYDFPVPPGEFVQQGTLDRPVIYWLDVQARPPLPTGPVTNLFGWKTTLPSFHFMDNAVYITNKLEPYVGRWYDMHYPPGHPFYPQTQTLDLAFRIVGTADVSVNELKWSQPPVPFMPTNVFYGWNEPSVQDDLGGFVSLVADDWVCTSATPLTDIHWWGSYVGWTQPYPPQTPDAFHIMIYRDVPKGPNSDFSHPGAVVWDYYSSGADLPAYFVGWDYDPRNLMAPWETCFKYDLQLLAPYWYQDPGTNIYWISIQAVYLTSPPQYPWGWKTRLRDLNSPAPDDAVRMSLSGTGGWQPIEYPQGTSWDTAFTLTTQPLTNCVYVVCPSNMVVICAPTNGLKVQYQAYATNWCTGQVLPVVCVPPSGSLFPVGNTQVCCTNIWNIWTNYCCFTVTVIADLTPPVITCPTNIDARTDPGLCSKSNVTFVATATDDCTNVTVTCNPPSGSTFQKGATTVICTATDGAGNSSSCSFTVTVRDFERPSITCPNPIVAGTDPGLCVKTNVTYAPIVSDNCPGVITVTCTPPSGSTFPKGVTTVTCTATDASANTNGCNFTVTIRDFEPPQVTCPTNIVASNNPGQCSKSNVTFTATATDNCPGVTIVCVPASGSTFGVGQTVVACTATDASTNQSVCRFTVTINDTEPPSIICPADLTVRSAECVPVPVQYPPPGVSDNCPGVQVVCLPPSGALFQPGTTTVKCCAFDTSSNSNCCTFTVYVACLDYGDAPDKPYPTLRVNNGARHVIVPGFCLGQLIDGEPDGQPNATATGDDANNLADEDGVIFATPLAAGTQACVKVYLTSGPNGGRLDAWVDFNANGTWESTEQIFASKLLGPGNNTLCFTVPANAALGWTFARFRLSTAGGLAPTGLADDGEVEDYRVFISQRVTTNIVITNLTVSSLYINGWDERSIYGSGQIAADDWVCTTTNPVTEITWWGSFLNWTSPELPQVLPKAFRIAIWTDMPAGPVGSAFSHPGQVIWQNICTNFTWQFSGRDRDPRAGPDDACFRFHQILAPDEWFYQGPSATLTNIYWISIAAEYLVAPQYPWGWKTRPRDLASAAPDDAVRIFVPTTPTVGSQFGNGEPIYWPTPTESWDLAFELVSHYTGEVYKYVQPPDPTRQGIDVNDSVTLLPMIPPRTNSYLLADDFPCTATGPLTDFTVWGSWYTNHWWGLVPNNLSFTLSVHADIPKSPTNAYSRPGKVLWYQTFQPGEFQTSLQWDNNEEYWLNPPSNLATIGDWTCWRYDFHVDPSHAFIQRGMPGPLPAQVYWLSVQAQPVGTLPVAGVFGWKTTQQNWNDDAVWVTNYVAPYEGMWAELHYPQGHPQYPNSMDLAFAVAGPSDTYQLKWSQPPVTNGLVRVDWTAEAGIICQLQATCPMNTGSNYWINVGPTVVSPVTWQIEYITPDMWQRYYRVWAPFGSR